MYIAMTGSTAPFIVMETETCSQNANFSVKNGPRLAGIRQNSLQFGSF